MWNGIAVERLSLLLRIHLVRGSNLGPDISYSDNFPPCFSSVPQGKFRIVHQIMLRPLPSNTVTCRGDFQRGLGLDIGFIDHIHTTCKYKELE
jgi:hypothetical protein